MLTENEIARYSRHLLLSEVGEKGQEKLKSSRVLVIGAGGLGSPVLQYLGAAGVGKIGIIDFDRVDESNLQRQVLFSQEDVGKSKSETAGQKLSRQNPFITVQGINARLTTQNALELFSGYDIIIDGTDNFSTRYLVNDACLLLGKTLVSGSIFKFQGQVSVFNHKDNKGNYGPTYRCLFPSPPPAGSAPACSEIGVMGVLPGIIGTLMANETIKIIIGIGDVLSGKVLLVDALTLNFHSVEIGRNPESVRSAPADADAFHRMDYDHFCGLHAGHNGMNEISADELASVLSSGELIRLVDVREHKELPEVPELKALAIPLGQIEEKAALIPRSGKVVVFCRSGGRSKKAIELLSGKLGFQNLFNLKGGAEAWTRSLNRKA